MSKFKPGDKAKFRFIPPGHDEGKYIDGEEVTILSDYHEISILTGGWGYNVQSSLGKFCCIEECLEKPLQKEKETKVAWELIPSHRVITGPRLPAPAPPQPVTALGILRGSIAR